MTQFSRFVGIDVSKDRLDVACHPDGESFDVPNTEAGFTSLAQRTAGDGVAYGCEATGGHEKQLLASFTRQGFTIFCLHPSDVRAFARLRGKRAKTDSLDAAAIAEALVAASISRKPTHRTELQNSIREIATLRRRLTAMQTELKSLAASTKASEALDTINAIIETLKKRVKGLEKANKQIIEADAKTSQTVKLIISVPGAGPVLATEIVASMSEIGNLSNKEAASIVGVAPHPRQSGKSRARGRCQGGRSNIRRVLWMAALSQVKIKRGQFYAFYDRLRGNGKPHSVAMVAVMRKMIVTINAVVRNQQPWSPELQSPT